MADSKQQKEWAAGDEVAVCEPDGEWYRETITRTTATMVYVGDRAFMRRSGREVGMSADGYHYGAHLFPMAGREESVAASERERAHRAYMKRVRPYLEWSRLYQLPETTLERIVAIVKEAEASDGAATES